jgi:SAM-dependent methyltransferase
MANFPPLKNYILYCADRLIAAHGLSGPFLDAGCGGGDVSLHLARKGWHGRAVDPSGAALARARVLLEAHPAVRVEQGSLFDQSGAYNTVLAMDVIEHLEDDAAALAQLASLLPPGGHLILSVPSNPPEWRWDDDGFGHYRRYTAPELREKLRAAGLTVLEIWDFTFPVFWIMRRAYTRIKSPPAATGESMQERTGQSSGRNPWTIPVVSGLLSRDNFLWRALYKWQFARFRHRPDRGHEVIALARKA